MAFCPNCGVKLEEGAAFCPNCGTRVESAARTDKTASAGSESKTENFSKKVAALNDTPDTTASFSKEDIRDNKLMAALCYIGILWLIPFFCNKDSAFVKFHLGQGLWTAIFSVASSVVSGVPLIGLAVWLATIILSVIGIINVINGKAKELPVVGSKQLLK